MAKFVYEHEPSYNDRVRNRGPNGYGFSPYWTAGMTIEELARRCDELEAKGEQSIILLVPGHSNKDTRRVAPKLFGWIVAQGPNGDFVDVKIRDVRRVLRRVRGDRGDAHG